MNGMEDIKFLSLFYLIKDSYTFYKVPVSVVELLLKYSRASHSKKSLI